MNSRTVTNVLLGVIAVSLAGPQVIPPVTGFLDRQFIEPWRNHQRAKAEEAERLKRLESECGENLFYPYWGWVIKLAPNGSIASSKYLPRDVAASNCRSRTKPRYDQVPEDQLLAPPPEHYGR